MCHDFLFDATFWQDLSKLDQFAAEQVRKEGCPHCGARLHSARYPRKPRGVNRSVLGEQYECRFSYCCEKDGCRKRCTPPSVRFLGRKVYLGVVITLICALEQGLTPRRKAHLIDELDLWPQTFARWQQWWREHVPGTRHWQSLRARLLPGSGAEPLPDALLRQLTADDLAGRVSRFLQLMMPLTSASCSRSVRLDQFPQKM